MLLPHIAARLYGTPLLLAREKLDVLLAVLGERIHWPAAQGALPAPAPRVRGRPDGALGIAVIPVYGTLVRRSLALDPASGLTSYADLADGLAAAVADPSVAGILLELDSPGGEAGGVGAGIPFDIIRDSRIFWAMRTVIETPDVPAAGREDLV